ncbi:MAG: hypothetical protein ACXWTX_00885 [Gallionella sp.]
MKAAQIIHAAQLDGVNVFLTVSGALKLSGAPDDTKNHAEKIRPVKDALIESIQHTPRNFWAVRFADGREVAPICFTPAENWAGVLAAYPAMQAAAPLASPHPLRIPYDVPASSLALLRGWLRIIGETHPEAFNEVLRQCREEAGAHGYYMAQARRGAV